MSILDFVQQKNTIQLISTTFKNEVKVNIQKITINTAMIQTHKTIALALILALTVAGSGLIYVKYLKNNDADAKKQYISTKKIPKITPAPLIVKSSSSQIAVLNSINKISSASQSNIILAPTKPVPPTIEVATTSSNIDNKIASASPVIETSSNCSIQTKINFGQTSNPMLKQLSKYQDICGSKVADKVMVFTQIPSNSKSAQSLAVEIAATLKEFSIYGITPLVIAEPTDGSVEISFTDFAKGNYNQVLDQYFAAIKQAGVTDQQMGIWVPFPEANIPVWNSVGSSPSDFGFLINNYSTSLKKYFPTTGVTILMNYVSFEPSDKGYTKPKNNNFDEYLQNIKPGMVNSFGMQGFPWVDSNRASNNSVSDPQIFLQPAKATRAASQLGVNTIWFNTGTVSSKYTQNPALRANVSANERKVINSNKVKVFDLVKNAGYNIWVNEFVQDKSNTAEQTNFSYLQTPQDQAIFKDYTTQLNNRGISLSIFDSN